MLVWATEFPVATGTCSDVLNVAKAALVSSPHSPWDAASLDIDSLDELTLVELDGQRVTLGRVDCDPGPISGLQHQWTENGEREWTTEVVACSQESRVLVSVRLDCNLILPGSKLPIPKKPYVVRKLLAELGGGSDGGLQVGDAPHRLDEWAVEDAARLVRGQSNVRLPVVYVSAGRFRQPFVDVDELAKWLGGMGHVVVEPSRHFSFALARTAGRLNAYGGAVSIYWPSGVAAQARFVPTASSDPVILQREVAERVRSALTHIRPASNCTFEYLQELVSRRRVDHLRSAGSTAVGQYVDAFDAELRAKDERLASLDREVARLKAELRRYDGADVAADGILEPGTEVEFYPGELNDAILHTLVQGRNNLLQDGRRWHLVDDLLKANKPTPTEQEFEDEIKSAFAKSGDLGAEQTRTLEDLGFTVEEAGKHHKAIYQGDDRYAFVISKTSSDHRAGKNLASTILKKLFK